MPGVSESEMRRAAMGFVWNVCRFVSWPFGGGGGVFLFWFACAARLEPVPVRNVTGLSAPYEALRLRLHVKRRE